MMMMITMMVMNTFTGQKADAAPQWGVVTNFYEKVSKNMIIMMMITLMMRMIMMMMMMIILMTFTGHKTDAPLVAALQIFRQHLRCNCTAAAVFEG